MLIENQLHLCLSAGLRAGIACRRSLGVFVFVAFILFSPNSAQATYKDLIGFPELQSQLGAGIPTGAGIAVQHIEAQAGGAQAGNYIPDAGSPEFSGKTFTNVTLNGGVTQGSAGISNHASGVGLNFYGNNFSIAPGINTIDNFEAIHWLGFQINVASLSAHPSGFLNTLSASAPDTTSTRIANHSWVGDLSPATVNGEVLRRLDFVVEQDDFLNVVGIQNGFANSDSGLLKTAFNDISVGLTNGNHLTGTLAVDSTYTSGRIAPTLVTPGFTSSNVATQTSSAVPMVSAASALLLETGQNASLSNGTITNRTRTINHAETSEVIKAVLMAGADRAVDNVRGADLTTYAIDASNNLDNDFGAGQLNVFHSYNILAAGEHDSDQDRGSSVDIAPKGWDYDTNFGGGGATNDRGSYFFTAANSGDTLHATLAWNLDVAGFTGGAANTTLHDLNLVLFDVTGNQVVSALGASSLSTTENTENIFFDGLISGNRYEIRVETAAGPAPFDWDYGLAWRIASIPEPSGVALSLLAALTALAARRGRQVFRSPKLIA